MPTADADADRRPPIPNRRQPTRAFGTQIEAFLKSFLRTNLVVLCILVNRDMNGDLVQTTWRSLDSNEIDVLRKDVCQTRMVVAMCMLELAVAELTRHPFQVPTKEERVRGVVQIVGNVEQVGGVVPIVLATWSSTDVWLQI